ncbi:MAG TPA: hypothetical protein VK666_14970 [Chryseolinea sp.]|nr:hypothetical protein [Chryseolinea sp.]
MMARIWHGKTSMVNYDAYTEFLRQVPIPDYQKTIGFKGLTFLRNVDNHEGHFQLITYWDNLEIIKNFAGQDFEKAKYYLEDKGFLLEFEERVQRYESLPRKRYVLDQRSDFDYLRIILEHLANEYFCSFFHTCKPNRNDERESNH